MEPDNKKTEDGKKYRQTFKDLEAFSMMIFQPVKKTTRLHSQTREQFKCYHPKKITIH